MWIQFFEGRKAAEVGSRRRLPNAKHGLSYLNSPHLTRIPSEITKIFTTKYVGENVDIMILLEGKQKYCSPKRCTNCGGCHKRRKVAPPIQAYCY